MWDQRYGEEGFAYGTTPNDFLVGAAEPYLPTTDANGATVLCLGEGEGRNAVWLAQRGGNFAVTGVDMSSVGLKKADALAKERNVSIKTVVADLSAYDMGIEKWDVITSIWCHTPPPLRKTLHANIAKALKPNGVFILEAYTPKQLEYKTGGPPVAEMMMTLDALKDELLDLEIVVGEEKIREVKEGKYHDGTSAVVQVVARRK